MTAPSDSIAKRPAAIQDPVDTETATFALGWFWGVDSRFGSLPGVVRTTVGYTGGTTADPDYQQIGDHSEAVRIDYDPRVISYRQLLEIFWASHDPGLEVWSRQYRNAVFTADARQREAAEQSREALLVRSNRPVYTAVEPAGKFFPAEDYHQKYLLRRAGPIFNDLRSRYASEAELLASTPATRINGYLGCNGKFAALEQEVDSFGLSATGREQLLAFVRSSCKAAAGPTCPSPD